MGSRGYMSVSRTVVSLSLPTPRPDRMGGGCPGPDMLGRRVPGRRVPRREVQGGRRVGRLGGGCPVWGRLGRRVPRKPRILCCGNRWTAVKNGKQYLV